MYPIGRVFRSYAKFRFGKQLNRFLHFKSIEKFDGETAKISDASDTMLRLRFFGSLIGDVAISRIMETS